jgi:uncharacterized protein DUF4926
MIRERDRVVLTAPVPKQRVERGDVGTVVHVYVEASAVRPVTSHEIPIRG